ncbi:Ser/Thr protein kinase RdoA involved in Cpx stress response, MazF antagonist [Paenibacillus sp. yr247]|uniref:phosphotransferase enzyme family protein n=1 Tax=Paenibacillus sp. yr247 TaxID=1761880 RepID=UPI000889F2CD|nr:aminoglycoside phosphotransferase family protein [Paenibacillus sp. yr247]SDN67494.1 Ser/Thr protein kinase RdoA involved in Cpx stress response, MazF antagonist [Paenibacillus sp. yr247]
MLDSVINIQRKGIPYMIDEAIIDVLSKYGIFHPDIEFLRHSENRTYKVSDLVKGNSYLLRIHQPITGNLEGLQHTNNGLISELQLLEEIAIQTKLIVQQPIRNCYGDFITKIEHDGKNINCSLLTWVTGKDMKKEDVLVEEFVTKLGAMIAELHKFFREYYKCVSSNSRPNQGIERNDQMLLQIQRGVKMEIILPPDFRIVEETIQLINSRLKSIGKAEDSWGIIHGDLNMGNVIVTSGEEICFIDFGLFGYGYYLLDVSMGALMVPAEYRIQFLKGYYGFIDVPEDVFVVLEGFMLLAIFGYYAFHMENEAVHPWISERMPLLCAKHCLPFLSGERIFYNL